MKQLSNRTYAFYSIVTLLILAATIATGCNSAAPEESGGAGSGSKADWPEKFVVGYFGGDDPNEVLERNEPFEAYLEERLGVDVEIFTGTSYNAVIEAMRAKRVDAMEVGPFSYILAAEEAGAEAMGVGVYSRAENPAYDPELPSHYFSTIFIKKGSGIESIADLNGKGFNFVDPASTSGHLMPKTYLIKQGLDPDNEMDTVFAGSHPTSVISVWNDKADAGATYESNLYRLRDEGQIDFCGFADDKTGLTRTEEDLQKLYDECPEGHIVILGMTDPIPSTPFAVRGDLPESFKAAVKEAVLDVKNNPELISQTARWYVDPSDELGFEHLDHYYNPLRDVAKLLDLDLHELGG